MPIVKSSLLPIARAADAILEVAPDAVIVADAAGRMQRVNHQAEVLFGYQRDALLGQPLEMLLPSAVRATHIAHRQQYMAEPRTRPMGMGMDLWGQRQDGHTFPVEISLSPLPAREGLFVVSIIRDISERKQLEAELHRAQQQTAQYAHQMELRLTLLQRLLDELPGGVYLVHGADARLILANQAAQAVWEAPWPIGLPMAAFLRQHGLQYTDPNGHPLAFEDLATMRVLRTGEAVRQFVETLRTASGHTFPLIADVLPLDASLLPAFGLEEQHSPVAVVVLHDVRVLKEAEQTKDAFISMAAHELRNPIAALLGFTDMLVFQTARGHGTPLETWQQEAMQDIQAAAARLNLLTQDLLDVARLQARRLVLHLSSQNLIPIIQRVIAQMRMTAPHPITLTTAEQHLNVLVDSARIEQVLLNLLSNAVKYSPEATPIEVTLTTEPSRAICAIRDVGIGIPARQHAHIFERFGRADNARDAGIPGTGLGLYLCRELIELHGGQMWFTSAEGEGSTFWFTLPRDEHRE